MNRTILIIFISVFCYSHLIAGGGWTQKKNKGYYKLSEWWIVFDEHYTDVGAIDPNITTGIFNTFLYAEYGLSDRVTGILNSSVFSRNYTNNLISSITGNVLIEGEALNAMGDTDLGLKYRLTQLNNPWAFSGSITLGIPTGKTNGGSQGNLQTGDGEFNQIIQFDLGRSLNIFRGNQTYFNTYLGFNHRTENFSEEIRFGFEFGIGILNNRLWMIGKNNTIESLKNGATAEALNSTTIFANNTEFSSFAIELNYYLKDNLGVSVSAAGASRGEIIAAAPSYSIGIFLDLTN